MAFGDNLRLRDGFEFSDSLAGVVNQQGQLGYVNPMGRLVIPFQFEDGTNHRGGFAGVLMNGMCGYIDRKGSLVVPLRYDEASSFRDGWGLVKLRPRYTYVNSEGDEIGQWFADAESFSEGLAAVAALSAEQDPGGRRYGFIDVHGQTAIAPRFEDAEPFAEGLAAVRVASHWGYIDVNGAMAIEPRFDLAGPFSEGLASVEIEGKMGYVDTSGAMVIEPRFETDRWQSDPDEKPVFVGRFVDGLAAVRFALGPEAEGGWGFINTMGEFVIAPRYENATAFSEGLAAVQQDDRWGYVDPTGTTVIAPAYRQATEFSQGFAFVCTE
jgi:hypothetical protein